MMRLRLHSGRRVPVLIAVLVAAALFAVPVGASAGPDSSTGSGASAVQEVQPWNEYFKLVSAVHPALVGAEPNLTVGMVPFEDSAKDRRWYAEPNIAKGGFYLTNARYAGMCLDTADPDPRKDGAGLVLRTCDQSYRQSWVIAFDPVRPNTVRLVNFHSKLLVTVTAPNTKLVGLVVTAYQPNGSAQVFFTDNCLQCG
jgi:hypothetical protein